VTQSDTAYDPTGLYAIGAAGPRAEVYLPALQFRSELRVRWLPDDAQHAALNELLAHVSVLELDHLAEAAALGAPFTVAPLDELVPRPGWELTTRVLDDPALYELRKYGEASVHRGARDELLLLLELSVRSALARYIGQPPPRKWVQRLRLVHPKLLQAVAGQELFARIG
jgi:hypothetical protein